MSTPFMGEIRLFAFPRVPTGWMLCDGSSLSVGQYNALYSVIGTAYGGDGNTTFNLPDLRGRVALHNGTGNGLSPRSVGDLGGFEEVILAQSEIPSHTHSVTVSAGPAEYAGPGPTVVPSVVVGDNLYITFPSAPPSPVTMSAQSIETIGRSGGHENCMPTVTLSYCIAVDGIYPSQG